MWCIFMTHGALTVMVDPHCLVLLSPMLTVPPSGGDTCSMLNLEIYTLVHCVSERVSNVIWHLPAVIWEQRLCIFFASRGALTLCNHTVPKYKYICPHLLTFAHQSPDSMPCVRAIVPCLSMVQYTPCNVFL